MVVVHGLAGSREQPQVQSAIKTLIDAGLNVVSYDATNSCGESGGKLSHFTLSKHREDLDHVIRDVVTPKFSGSRLILCGFSLGGTASILHAAVNGLDIGVIAIAPPISGKNWLSTLERYRPGTFACLERDGKFYKECRRDPDKGGYLGQEFVTDFFEYNLLQSALRLPCPPALAVGENDLTVLPDAITELAKIMKSPLIRLKDCPHTLETASQLAELRNFIADAVSLVESSTFVIGAKETADMRAA